MKRILYQNKTSAKDLLLPKNSMTKFGGVVENARLDREGNLVLREGFESLHTFSATVRAFSSEEDEGFVLAGNRVYYYDGTDFTQVGTVETSYGNAVFEKINSDLYLYDGAGFYKVTDEEITTAEGYVPLYGKDWDPVDFGEVNEPLNLLSDKARIHYLKQNPCRYS